MKKGVYIILLILSMLIFLGACNTYNMKGVKEDNINNLAILNMAKTSIFSHSIIIHSIDAEPIGWGLHDSFKLLPGERLITVIGNVVSGLNSEPKNLLFNVESGKIYELSFEKIKRSGSWNPMIIDLSTGKNVIIKEKATTCTNYLKDLGETKCNYGI